MSNGARSARAASKVSLAILISRILGLVRDQFFAKLFGAGLYNDAWLVALRIPNMLRDLFAEGALSAAFVPTFTEHLKAKGKTEAWYLANLVMSGLLILLGITALTLYFFSDFFVTLLAAGFAEVEGKVEITSTLVKILSPFLMLIAIASVAMGVLNTLNHFFIPALAPAFYNLALIGAALFLVPAFEENGVISIYAMGVGAIVGGLLQYFVQIPLLRREGYRFRFRVSWSHPGIRRIARLIGPAIVGVSAVQVNVLINTQLASFLQENGPVSWLAYAFRIIYLPIGLFGVSVGVVNLKEVSALATHQRFSELKQTLANSVKLVSFLAIPSTVGLIVLAIPIVDVLFERGGFSASDTRFTAFALIAYSLGLAAYSCNKIFVPTFYALNDTRTPVKITLRAVVINLIACVSLILLLPVGIRYVGLALGTSISVTLSSSMLALGLKRRLGSFRDLHLGTTLSKVVVLGLIMGGVVFLTNRSLQQAWGDMNLLQEILELAICVATGLAVYCGGAWLWKVKELSYLVPFLKR